MTTVASQITSLAVVYSTVYSGADERKHQSSASLAFVRGIHRDRWIPRTNGQLRGKCFHLMTSSWLLQVKRGWWACLTSLVCRIPKLFYMKPCDYIPLYLSQCPGQLRVMWRYVSFLTIRVKVLNPCWAASSPFRHCFSLLAYSTVYSGAGQRKHQSSASLAFWLVHSPHKGTASRKMFPFDDFIMSQWVLLRGWTQSYNWYHTHI